MASTRLARSKLGLDGYPRPRSRRSYADIERGGVLVTRTRSSLNGAGPRAEHPVRDAREKAETGSGWYAWLARSGLVAKGVSFGIVGALAIDLAATGGGKATTREGALHTLAGSMLGAVLLVLPAIGFARTRSGA